MSTRKRAPINPRDFNGRKDEDILAIIVEDMDRAKKFLTPKFEKFRAWNDVYNCKADVNQKREGANLYIPYAYSTVETAIPKILGSIFDSSPFISYKPVTADDEAKAVKMTALVEYQMKQKMKASSVFYNVFKTSLILGTAITKQTWRYEEKTVIKREFADTTVQLDDGTPHNVQKVQPVERTVVTYDAPYIESVEVDKFFFDPAYYDIPESPFVCHEYSIELYRLQEGEQNKLYRNVKKLSSQDKQEESKIGTSRGDMKDAVKIWEYWTDDWKVMVANESVVIQCIRNPYCHRRKPFTKWAPVPMPNEFYGKSMIETLVDLQEELNTLRNQRIDNVSMAINRMFKLRRGAEIDTAQLVSRPNGFIEVDELDDITELDMKDVTQSAYADEEIVKADMDVTSGVHSYDRGQPADRRDTATVASLLTSASSERFKLQVMMMEEDPMTDMGSQICELNKQFLTDEIFIKVTRDGQEQEDTVVFEDIDAEFDVVAVGTAIEPTVNKEVRQSQLIQLMNVASNVEGVDRVALMKRIFKEFGFKEVDDMFLPPAQPMESPQLEGQMQLPPSIMGAEQTEQPQQDVAGLYPQLGGVGGLGEMLQNPNANM